jgi:hypothetical protein
MFSFSTSIFFTRNRNVQEISQVLTFHQAMLLILWKTLHPITPYTTGSMYDELFNPGTPGLKPQMFEKGPAKIAVRQVHLRQMREHFSDLGTVPDPWC